jgi:23S rRNA (adenine2503-C2)-methyltransferase
MQRSEDGTVKNAVRLHDGLVVESVLIPTIPGLQRIESSRLQFRL